jgi:hypothetical protein
MSSPEVVTSRSGKGLKITKEASSLANSLLMDDKAKDFISQRPYINQIVKDNGMHLKTDLYSAETDRDVST